MWLFGLDLDFGNLDKIQNSTSNAHFTVGVRPFIYLFIHVELLNDVIGFCVVFLITKQKCFFYYLRSLLTLANARVKS